MYSNVRKLLGTGGPAISPSEQSTPLPLKSASGPSWPPEEVSSPLASPIALQSPPQRPSMRAPPIRKSLDEQRSKGTAPSTPVATPATTSLPPQTPSRRFSPSRPLNTRDELLISLMASEAVVDSRDFDILDAEQVDELKKEYQLLFSRTEALSKKLTLETKIRDAALSLSRVNSQSRATKTTSTSGPSSSSSPDQLEAANARVDRTQRELTKLTQRTNDVHRMLMEHRAGVLSFSVRNLEKKVSGAFGSSGYSDDSGYDSSKSNRSTLLSPATPAMPSTYNNANVLSGLMSPKSKFDGAHLFAGHADTIVPRMQLSAEAAAASIASLETRLKEAQQALVAAGKKQAEMGRELAMMKLEKQEVETMLGMDLQSAEETISKLQVDLNNTAESTKREDEMAREMEERLEEETRRLKEEAERERQEMQIEMEKELERQRKEWEEREREERERLEQEKEAEIERLRLGIEDLQAQFEEERRVWEDEKMEDLARLQEEMESAAAQSQNQSRSQSELSESQSQANAQLTEELDFGLQTLQQMVKTHGIVLFARDSSLQGLLNAISIHLDSVHKKLETYTKAESEWDALRRKMEEDVRAGLDKREAMAREIENARRERDAALASAAAATTTLANVSNSNANKRDTVTRDNGNTNSTISFSATDDEILSILQPLWTILPSPEARAAKFGAGRSFRTGSPTPNTPLSATNPNANGVITSLSDLDVRSLKALYTSTRGDRDRGSISSTISSLNPTSPISTNNSAPFSLPAFAARVQALINDDKALIERLIRFAQAHDLLKKNAERAQKLAQDGTHALETYQKQVRTLEERGKSAWAKVTALQEELHLVHEALERVTAEKHNLEAQAAEQAETCRQLTEANNTLSARTLTLAEEAAQAPAQVRRHLEVQMQEMQAKMQADMKEVEAKMAEMQTREEETRKKLEAAQEEVDMMRNSEQSQRIALLDELNSMQTENGNLRAQLRAAKK